MAGRDLRSAADVRAAPFETGRGYRTEPVETFRAGVAALIEAQQQRIDQLQEAVDALRGEMATEAAGPDLRTLLRRADPQLVAAEATAAAGEVLALAVDAAARHDAKVRADLATARSQVVGLLEQVVAVAKEGRRPDYDLYRLVIATSGLIERLSAAS